MPSVWPPPVNLPSQTRWMNTKDWFHTRKKYTVPLVLLAMLLVMAFLTIGVPYLLSIQQGDVSQAQVSVSLGGGFPQEHQVQAGMEQIKDTFQANFHNCQLLELHFDAVYTGVLQGVTTQELNALMVNAQPATLMAKAGKQLDQNQRDILRAQMAREACAKIKE